jgi:hypothetical protein
MLEMYPIVIIIFCHLIVLSSIGHLPSEKNAGEMSLLKQCWKEKRDTTKPNKMRTNKQEKRK